ncbi:hypothetical protein SAY87_020086 [Trapa incisa]|uniref:UspA domain-containing protein n=1 Tax=Trapa incisa TaxID=236973 RepID=A0AAN7K901_9MYRT|nr:hypothetical protein SAY87_020086 [Trapa incisa]
MGRSGVRLPGFCLNRIRPHGRVRSPPPPPLQAKPKDSTVHLKNQEPENDPAEEKPIEAANTVARKVMIVVDSSVEARGALHWALSHTVQTHDTVVLLHVMRPTHEATCDECSKERAPRAYELVQTMKNMCQLRKPQAKIETLVVQGKDKGPIIVEEARRQGAALLVLGQKKQHVTWRLLLIWTTRVGRRAAPTGSGGGVVEYCIQNAGCMTIAVRRKSKRLGGYLITTKRQKDFWLLA